MYAIQVKELNLYTGSYLLSNLYR